MAGLVLSFRSKYDGYIYPYWKSKLNQPKMFYEDAVVVGEDFIVLGDGLGGTSGFSGIFSNYQCLKIADKIKSNKFNSQQKLFEAVEEASREGIQELGLSRNLGILAHVATTLVYAKLDGKILRTGVTGDSGYSIYRYDPTERILKLIMRSKETTYKFNAPHNVNPYNPIDSEKTEHEVQEGDIVVMATDGVLDVFSSSFMTAATNYLVKKMLEKQKKDAKPEEYHLDFDYDYDMADFLEAYILNLNQVTRKLQDSVVLKGDKTNKKNVFLKFIESAKQFFKKEKSVDQKIKKNSVQDANMTNQIDALFPQVPANTVMTDRIIDFIYKYEICNVFNPMDSKKIFKLVNAYQSFTHLGIINNPSISQIKQTEPINCFNLSKIEKKTLHHKDSPKWECQNILDLTYPLEPPRKKSQSHHDFKECVRNAIPKLPEGVTAKMIASVFNSRYFARNIALAAKFMSMDQREKIGDFLMKKYYVSSKRKFKFPKNDLEYKIFDWQAKSDDIGIAAAAVLEKTIYDRDEKNNIPTFNQSFETHLKGISTVFNSMKDKYLFRNFII